MERSWNHRPMWASVPARRPPALAGGNTRTARLWPVAVALLALAGTAACGSRATPAGGSPPTTVAPAGSSVATPAGSPTGSASTAQGGVGEVWPIEARTIAAPGGTSDRPAVLTAMRTSVRGGYERLVLDFDDAFGAATIRYVPVVRADPSDRPVPLRGRAFLQVTIQGAVAHWNTATIAAYTGPSTLTPGYPTLQQVSISGDFEAVLSFGIGLDRIAGFRVMRLSTPDRLVIDLAE
jgi:hypothetical protein